MNHYRIVVLAAAASAAAISLAACTVTTAASPASSPALAGSTVSVSGPVGRFPVPPGAQLINDGTGNGHYDIVFGSVSPSEASRFYTTALPRAGSPVMDTTARSGRCPVSTSLASVSAGTPPRSPSPRSKVTAGSSRQGKSSRPRGLRQQPGAAALPGIRPDHPPGIRDLGVAGTRTNDVWKVVLRKRAVTWSSDKAWA